MIRNKKYWPFYAILGASVILILFFLFDWYPFLRGGYGWRWPYVKPETAKLIKLLPVILAIGMFFAGVWLLRSTPAVVYVIWCVLGATLIPLALLYWWGDPLELLFTRTVSGLATGGFSVATKMDGIGSTLQHWLSTMPTLKSESIHVALSMPGWPIGYYSLTKVLEALPFLSEPLGMVLRPYLCHEVPIMNLSNAQLASSWLGIFSPFWAALTVIPLFLLGRTAVNEPVARTAVAWWPLVPSLAMFLGSLSTPTPLIAMTMIYFLWTGLDKGKVRGGINWRLLIAGVLTALAIILTFAFAPLLLFAGLLALLMWSRSPDQSLVHEFREPLLAGIYFGLGFITVFILYTVVAGHSPLEVFRNAMQIHLDLKRKYFPWLWLHTWDFIIFVGLPAFGLFMMGLTRWGSPQIRRLAIALALTLGIVVLSGTGRGETGRLWFYFMPLILLVAADLLVQLPAPLRIGFLTCQTLWLLSLFTALPTIGTGLTPPPAYDEVRISTASPMTPKVIDFGGMLLLEGYHASFNAAGDALSVELYWRPQKQLSVPYYFSALLVTPAGAVLPAIDWQPFSYQYPTTCWSDADAPLVDRITLPLGDDDHRGGYWMSLAVFELSPGGEVLRLPVYLPDGAHDTQVGLGPLPSD